MTTTNTAPAETTEDTLARWARIDAMHADGQYAENGPQQYTTADFFAEARARREAAAKVGWGA